MGRSSAFERLRGMVEHPELISGSPLVEVLGNKRVLVERHLGVTEYSGENIDVRVPKGKILISGASMKLIKMTKEQLVIIGSIDKVEFLFGDG